MRKPAYIERTEQWLRGCVKETRARNAGFTETTECLYGLGIDPLRQLLTDPVGGPAIAPELCVSPPAVTGAFQNLSGLQAIGVHAAGEFLPRGRHSHVHVARNFLDSIAANGGATAAQSEKFLLLFNEVQRRFLGRQHTLIHALLHQSNDKGSIIEMPLAGWSDGTFDSATKAPEDRTQLPLGPDIAKELCDKDLLDQILKIVRNGAGRMPDFEPTQSQQMLAAVSAFAEGIVTTLRTEKNQQSDAFQFAHRFHTRAMRACYGFGSPGGSDRDEVARLLCGPAPPSDPNPHLRIEESMRMLQLFFLYRAFCGDWFYVLIPPKQTHLHMCFTVGVSEQLKGKELGHLNQLVETIRGELDEALRSAVEKLRDENTLITQARKLSDMLSEAGPKFFRTCLGEEYKPNSTPLPFALGGLPCYLALCERISEVAVHEGAALHFDFVVGDGVFASQELDQLSLLSNGEQERYWLSDKHCKDGQAPQTQQEEVVSRLIGNHAFLQHPGVVLFGSREGRLLYIAKTLTPGTLDPEKFTALAPKRCYLVRVDPQGDISIFYTGRLVLWRRAGQYIVPERYGKSYREPLADYLRKAPFSLESGAANILANAVWNIANRERAGTTFVVGRFSDPWWEQSCIALTEVFPYAEGLPLLASGGQNALEQLAVQDGAVVIDCASNCVYGRRQLYPHGEDALRQFVASLKEDAASKNRFPDWHKRLRWGTRHHSALAFSFTAHRKQNGGVLVITVSSDGDIHVLENGRPVDDFTYPTTEH